MAYEREKFQKTRNGVDAPLGFHYMPNGKLMNDAHHIAAYGYYEKEIKSVKINTNDLPFTGETRSFSINGDPGSIFSVEIYDDSGNYYNFYNKTWSTTKSRLDRVEIDELGYYEFSVGFDALGFVDKTCDYNNDPTIAHDDDDGKIEVGMSVTGTGIPDGATVATVSSDTSFELSVSTTGGAVTNGALTFRKLKTYKVDIWAETVYNIKTKHSEYFDARFIDNTLDINNCRGSNSSLLQKRIYQDVKKNLYISCIAPSLHATSADTVNGAVSSSKRIVIDGSAVDPNVVQVGDLVTGTGIAAAVHALVDVIDPDGDNTNEIETTIADSIGNDVAITFTPPFNGVTPHGSDSTTGRQAIDISSGQTSSFPFSITLTAPDNRVISAYKTPTTDDLCAIKEITFESAALAISGEDTDSSAKFYRWPVTNIAGLSGGMKLDPSRSGSGANTTTPASIQGYATTSPSATVSSSGYGSVVTTASVANVTVPAIDSASNDITAIDRTGVVTAQKGNIVFDIQQLDALKADANVKIYGHGKNEIKQITGATVTLKDVVITPTQVSTTTSGAVSSSTQIGLTEVGGIGAGQSIRGVGIDPAVVNPIVVIKKAGTGAAIVQASVAQTLESGQTLFFDGASSIITITGVIEVENMGISDTTLFLDLERFITSR
tara:strand:+ start:195 stop:2180 length:1986 start_codon:yes stop_codon:yes gene_type:complete